MHGDAHLLVIEDDPTIREALSLLLEGSGYRVTATADDEGLDHLVVTDPPDLAIIDRALPSGDGLEITKWLRETRDLPVIILTASGAATDRIGGYAAGADRYIVKPYDNLEVVLAVQALLRRAGNRRRELVIDDLVIDEAAHRISRAGQPLDLPPKQYAILVVLARNAGDVVAKPDLLEQVWGPGYHDVNLVEAQVAALRRRLDDTGPPLLTTVRGVGYRLDAR